MEPRWPAAGPPHDPLQAKGLWPQSLEKPLSHRKWLCATFKDAWGSCTPGFRDRVTLGAGGAHAPGSQVGTKPSGLSPALSQWPGR